MRPAGSPEVLEYRRRLAVQRIAAGYSTRDVAGFLGVDPSSVRRWLASFRLRGSAGLAGRPAPGRPPKLTRAQEKLVRRWLADSPTAHGFATDLWSAPRLALLIEQEFGVAFHPDYLTAWLRRRGYTPQKPRRAPRERDEAAIAGWLDRDWPRIKKRPAAAGPAWCGWTRAGC